MYRKEDQLAKANKMAEDSMHKVKQLQSKLKENSELFTRELPVYIGHKRDKIDT